MQPINVYIDKSEISIDNDTRTSYKFKDYYLEKLEKEEPLSPNELMELGKSIYDNIFSTDDRRKRLEQRLKLGDKDSLSIKITAKDAIHNIPFELINKDGTATGFLLKKGNISIVRDTPAIDKNISVTKSPIKILILVSLPLETYANSPLDPLKELEVIYKALDEYIGKGIVEVDVEEKVNIPCIKERLLKNSYDIVHFTGHGARGGYLVIEDEEDNTREKLITAKELQNVFQNSNIKLFYFDACQTALSEGISPSLAHNIYQEIPTGYVIANIASVGDKNATEFTHNIYKTLFEEEKIGNVLNMARMKLAKDWWKPVLFGDPDKKIFNIDKNQIKKETEQRVIERPAKSQTNYVYRYGIVREASNLIEDRNYLVLHGIGGAGKSVLANYLSLFYDARFRHILFFDLKNITGPENLLDEILSQLRRKKFIDNTEFNNIKEETSALDLKDRIFDKWDYIKEKLEGRTLLILDNMEGTMQDEKGLIKKEWHQLINDILNTANIFTIFTSRQKPYLTERSPLDNILEIGEYMPAEFLFLIRGLKGKDLEYVCENADEIISKFGKHPLSISKAIEKKFDDLNKVMEQEKFKKRFEYYRPYFEMFKDDISKLFMLENPFSNKFMEKIFHADFIDMIKNKLLILNKYDDLYLPYKVLEAYFKQDFKIDTDTLIKFKQDIVEIYGNKEYSGYDIFNIFSVLMTYYDKTRDKNIEQTLANVFKSINFSDNQKFMGYFHQFVELIGQLNINDEQLAITYNNIACVYKAKGEHDSAIEFSNKALAIQEAKLGKDHTSTATTYNNIANIYQYKGEYDRAIDFYNKALAITEAKLGKDHTSTASSYNNIACVYKAKGEHDSAIEFSNKALAIQEAKLGKDHTSTASTYNNIAGVYQAKGEYDRAIEFYNKALAIQEAKLGKDHTSTATTYNNIASVYQDKGDYDKAIELYNKALAIVEVKLGKDHTSTAISYNNIANVYQSKGEYDRAIEFYNKALAIQEAKLGKDHTDTAISYNNIACVYQAKMEYDRAIEFYNKALAIQEAKLGKDHTSTAITYNNIANIYQYKGESDRAIELFNKALAITEAKLGKDHTDTAISYNNIAGVYKDKGEYDRAIEFYNKALAIQEAKLGKDHTSTAISYNNIAGVYQDKGEYDRAIESYHKALAIYKNNKDYLNLLMTYPFLINAYTQASDFNYHIFTDYLCEFIDLWEIFMNQENIMAFLAVLLLIKEKTFEKIDIAEVKKHIKHPVYRDKVDNFIGVLKNLSSGLSL